MMRLAGRYTALPYLEKLATLLTERGHETKITTNQQANIAVLLTQAPFDVFKWQKAKVKELAFISIL